MSNQRFVATFGEQKEEVQVTALGDGRYRVMLGGIAHEVDARRFGGGSLSLLIDHQSYDLELEVAQGTTESLGHYNILVRDKLVQLTVRDERHERMGLSPKPFKVEGHQLLTAPLPGKVVRIFVEPGQEVEEGAPLLVIEAMKMENELRSPKKGRVSAVLVKEGKAVEAGARLVSVD